MTHVPVLVHDRYHRYQCDCGADDCPIKGQIFRSVTTILGKAVPKNLSWHGQTRGVIGVKGLVRIPKYNVRRLKALDILEGCIAEGILPQGTRDITPADRVKLSAVPRYDIAKMPAWQVTDALKRHKLTVNDHRDEAAVGGSAVHKALEDYIDRGVIPSASSVPESKRGSIRGLAKFIVEYRPKFTASEVRVLSIKHSFAGTFDFLADIHAELYVNDDKKLKLRPADATLFALGDVKTSKWVYPSSHFPQLEAYEGGRLEAGDKPSDIRVVLWVDANGNMELAPSTSTFADFLALKQSAEVIERLDKSWKRPKRPRPEQTEERRAA